MIKQTAVEWLVDELRNQIEAGTLDAIVISKLKMQAKAMERERIEGAFNGGTNFDSYHPNCPAGNTYYEAMYEKRKTMVADLKDFFNFSRYKKKK